MLNKDILDSLGEGVITVDKDFRVTFFNRAAEIITGYKRDEVAGRLCKLVFDCELCETKCPIGLVLETNQNIYDFSFQSLSYQGDTWVAMAPSYAHTITKDDARTCIDCHVNMGGTNDAIADYNDDGIMQFGSWNSSDSTLSWLLGIVPLPADYIRSFKMDFIQYDGDWSSPPGTDNKNWAFVKGEADGFQLFFGTPLTVDQMEALGFDITLVGVEGETNTIPSEYILDQNYPNPFNPSTTIKFSIPENSTVELTVYNQLGEFIQTLVNEEKSAGNYEITFNAQNLSNGVYFYHINANNFVSTKKLMLLK